MSDAKVKKAVVVLTSIALSVSSLASAGLPRDFGIMKTPKPVTNGLPRDFGVM